MDRETVIALALEAGISESHAQGMQGFLERFAALVAAHEREECARVCDRVGYDHEVQQGAELAFDLATVIRSRGVNHG